MRNHEPAWTKGRLLGHKPPLKPKEIRAIVRQRKTHRPVQFEITELTRDAVVAGVGKRQPRPADYVSPGRKVGAHL